MTMKTVALAAVLSLGLSAPALAQTTTGQDMAQDDGAEMAQRLDIPTPENATLRECQAWLGQLGVTINNAQESDLGDAEDARQEVARACDDGDYHEGITLAAETIGNITGEDFSGTAADDQRMEAQVDIPTREDATLRECQAWLDELGVTIEAAETRGDSVEQAEQRRDEVAQACDDGDYHRAITMAAETIELIDGEADEQQGGN
jgi:hypothetical protein